MNETIEIKRDVEDWFYSETTCVDAKYIDEEGKLQYAIHPDYIKAMSTLSEQEKRREYYCDYETEVPGAYFSKELQLMREEKRICNVPVIKDKPVNTYWDFGIGKQAATSIWFNQTVFKEARFPHYYESTGVDIGEYINYLKDWRDKHGVTFGTHWLPHDGGTKSLQTGLTMQERFAQLGIENTDLVPVTADLHRIGIENIRLGLSQSWIDKEGCKRGLECLSAYRKEQNKKSLLWIHVHDWASHGTDAYRTFADWFKDQQPLIEKKGNIVNYEGYTTGLPEEIGTGENWLEG